MKDKHMWDLASVASIPLVMTLGNSMLIPVLPTMEEKLSVSSFQISMIITIYSLVAIVLIPVAGFLSDFYGRKRMIIPSLIIAAIGGSISGWAAWQLEDSYSIILFGRFLQGVGAAGTTPIVMPLVGDIFQEEKDVSHGLGVVETSNTFGKVLSPILGAWLATFTWFLPFFAFPVFCFISLIGIIFLVKTPKKSDKPLRLKDFWKEIRKIIRRESRWLISVFITGALCMFVVFGVLFYLSTMLEDEHQIEGVSKGVVLAIPLASLCISSYLTGKKIGKEKNVMKWVIFSGLLVLTGANVSVAFTKDIYVLLTAMFIIGMGIGVALPCLDALVTEGIAKEERGTITSIYNSMRFVGIAAAPPLVALLMKASHVILFSVVASLSFIAMLIVLIWIRPNEKQYKALDNSGQ
ncbi:MFS transporter [Texcoconibacillus texcoconensis]|uniref:ACDE family multidrug resistance protein n=1 Tax=Texcoconibacillus texcoconensis TaxID=1095777 RepID=A0A840QN95_9BACI|nr:MFS transporter [Texcoconibacillus texcoconensis]MBB5172828.1 ACDE family multidrug resistance protein [Texcoconibacillus texcoconensis]